jgi:hypothetical protein
VELVQGYGDQLWCGLGAGAVPNEGFQGRLVIPLDMIGKSVEEMTGMDGHALGGEVLGDDSREEDGKEEASQESEQSGATVQLPGTHSGREGEALLPIAAETQGSGQGK